MKKITIGILLLNYLLIFLAFTAFCFLSSVLYRLSGGTENLGITIVFLYATVFVGIPIVIAVLMRFSLLPWFVDPFAASVVPLYLYFGMVLRQTKAEETVAAAFGHIHDKLNADSGMGWIFLAGLFLFGLLASCSFDRKEGKNIPCRLLSRILTK